MQGQARKGQPIENRQAFVFMMLIMFVDAILLAASLCGVAESPLQGRKAGVAMQAFGGQPHHLT